MHRKALFHAHHVMSRSPCRPVKRPRPRRPGALPSWVASSWSGSAPWTAVCRSAGGRRQHRLGWWRAVASSAWDEPFPSRVYDHSRQDASSPILAESRMLAKVCGNYSLTLLYEKKISVFQKYRAARDDLFRQKTRSHGDTWWHSRLSSAAQQPFLHWVSSPVAPCCESPHLISGFGIPRSSNGCKTRPRDCVAFFMGPIYLTSRAADQGGWLRGYSRHQNPTGAKVTSEGDGYRLLTSV